jgi:hypothetical protein
LDKCAVDEKGIGVDEDVGAVVVEGVLGINPTRKES